MPIVAMYRHRVIPSDFAYPSQRAKNPVRALFVGRTKLRIEQRYGTRAATVAKTLRRVVRDHAVLLCPDPNLQDWRWEDTEGHYPLGSPYDAC